MANSQPNFELNLETQATHPVVVTTETTEPPWSSPYDVRYLFWRNDDIPGIRYERGYQSIGWCYNSTGVEHGSATIEDNVWYHLAMTCDGVDMNGYVDGVLDATYATNIQDPSPYAGTYIGMDSDPTRSWWGSIDDVRIYNKVLSSTEIGNIVNKTTDVTSGLIHRWEFENNYDDSIGDYDGDPQGNPQFESGVIGQCLNLDGYADGVSIGTTPVLPENPPWTVAFWSRRGFYKGRSEKWQIQLTTTPKPYYGYGYGDIDGFQPIAPTPELDYFNVLGIAGLSYGYGLLGTETTSAGPSMDWGWGYEWANAILANNSDMINVCARVLENGIPQANVRVTFVGSPDVIFDNNTKYTDANGYACVNVKIDKDTMYDIINSAGTGGNLDNFVNIPLSGIMMVKSIINQGPEYNNNAVEVETSVEQLFYEQSVSSAQFFSYGYQHYSYAYGIWA